MLTQKGREPFIRMKIFCEDPEAVKRLMSNQYKSGLPGEQRSARDTPSLPGKTSFKTSKIQSCFVFPS